MNNSLRTHTSYIFEPTLVVPVGTICWRCSAVISYLAERKDRTKKIRDALAKAHFAREVRARERRKTYAHMRHLKIKKKFFAFIRKDSRKGRFLRFAEFLSLGSVLLSATGNLA